MMNKKSIRVYPIQTVYGRFTDMKCMNNLALALLAMALCLPLQAAKVYKWQDADGAWHFSEKPPVEQSAETIKIPTPGKGKEVTATTPDQIPEGNKAKKSPDPETKKSEEVATEDAALARENCLKARENLENLQRGSRLRVKDPETDQVRYLSTEEQNEWMEKSRTMIKDNCQ
ncbi:MAG: DUF4124 domain-containing protein [Porticoccus sp.]|jgi:hypothetical protein|uniref:DUF4124 domain-containing protein n=1 Tax=Porticoccus sp. TaxID=2024853 RepID=UPI00329889A9